MSKKDKALPEISTVELTVRLKNGAVENMTVPLSEIVSIFTAAYLYNRDEQKKESVINIDLTKEPKQNVMDKVLKAMESHKFREEELEHIEKIEKLWK